MTHIGIDVSKKKLDIHILPDIKLQVNNDKEGVKTLLKRIDKVKEVELIVIEASGGYQNYVVCQMADKNLPVVVINPRKSKAYAKAKGVLAKTDRIDAKLLAEFGRDIKPEVRPIPNEQMRSINAILARREQLVIMRTAEKNRLKQAHESVAQMIQDVIDLLDEQIAQIDKDLDDTIRQTPIFREKDDLLRSVPGVGPILSRVAIFRMPELGLINRQQAAALVGVAPFNDESGEHAGKRVTWGGRSDVRSVLYMATISAITYNPTIKEFYQRLRKTKPSKVAITACMRKLITILNSILYSRTPWEVKPS